jgi:gliding motility-associatede transport system auxiliary component
VRGPATLLVAALRRPVAADGTPPAEGPRSRIAVVGDSDFATNSFFHIMGNGTLFLNAVNYLAAQENLIGIQPRTADLPRVNLTNRQMKGTLFLSVVLVPAVLAVIGTAVWWKQH